MSHCSARQLIGQSEEIRRLVSMIPDVADAKRITLISGPTGSGKEVLASMLHREAFGDQSPYVPIHCGALPNQLVETELFGHTRGAFTGALQSRPGLVKSATKGTLLLDEIDSLSLGTQVKLLRFLETGEYRAVGCDKVQKADTWVLAATNRDLEDEVKNGRFREDLFFRLDVIHLKLPPLSLRGGDIELLARHFLNEKGGPAYRFTSRAISAMYDYDWPGNVRELKHRIERAVFRSQSGKIDVDDLELSKRRGDEPDDKASSFRLPTIDEIWQRMDNGSLTLSEATAYCEKALIHAALQAENNNRTRAAKRLGIHVRTIFKKLSR